MNHGKVIERVYERWRVREAWQQIKGNAGAAGIDKMTVEELEGKEDEFLELIHEKLKEGIYRFKPARRVLIPKEGTSYQIPALPRQEHLLPAAQTASQEIFLSLGISPYQNELFPYRHS